MAKHRLKLILVYKKPNVRVSERKTKNNNFSQNQVAKQLGRSKTTIARYRDELNKNSPDNRTNNKRKKMNAQRVLIK